MAPQLPPILMQDQPHFVPLSSGTARHLVFQLLRSGGPPPNIPAEAFLADPAFTLWSICQAPAGAIPTTLNACAAWSRTVDWEPLLLGPESPGESALCSENERHQLTRARHAVTRALAAERNSTPWQDAPEVLRELLRGGLDWLGAGGRPQPPVAELRQFLSTLPNDLGQAIQDRAPGSPGAPLAAEWESRLAATWDMAPPGDDWPRLLLLLCGRLADAGRLANEFAVRLEREKLAAIKELAYGAGHEINNPLANISSRAQTLLRHESDPERRRTLAQINHQAFRAYEMIADMMLFAKPPELQLESVDLAQLLRQVTDELRETAKTKDVDVALSAPEAALVQVDPVQWAVAVKAVCTNALEAMDAGGQLSITVRPVATGPPPVGWCVAISDTGPGISEEVRRHIFDPFFSGREAGRGLGFGLSKAWRIVTEHQGHITVESPAGGGATFALYLPPQPTSTAGAPSRIC